MRAVLDTNILVRAFASHRGSANEILRTLVAGRHTLVISEAIVYETARILREPRMTAFHRRTEEDVYHFSIWLRQVGYIVLLDPSATIPI